MERNAENLRKLADIIAAEPAGELHDRAGFNMLDYWHPCGTPSCIAGYMACTVAEGLEGDFTERAEKVLGLYEDEADELFCPVGTVKYWTDITPTIAAQHLRDLADGQSVDWKRYFPEA